MVNNIMINGCQIISNRKSGRCNFLRLSNETEICASTIYGKPVEIECHACGKNSSVKFYSTLFKRVYLCQHCDKIGSKNPFYGKRHDQSFCQRLSKERAGTWCAGEKNAMFGVNVWDSYSPQRRADICRRISEQQTGEKNIFWGKTHSPETRAMLARKSSEYIKNHPEHLRKMIYLSFLKQSKGFKSSIEKIVQEELTRRCITHKYNKILNRKYQFDFIIAVGILLEVNGDYWHANPIIYKDALKYTRDQVKKVDLDIRKRKYAEEYGYVVFSIWEADIRKGNFEVIDSIVSELERRCKNADKIQTC